MRISDWSSDVCSSDLKELLAEGISSQAQYDQAVLAVQTAKQSIQTARQQSESVRATLSGHVDAPAEQQPEVQRAQAALDRALLHLGYTTVRAPHAGIVTKVTQFQVGDFFSASRPVFTLVGPDRKSPRLNSSTSCASRMPSSACT